MLASDRATTTTGLPLVRAFFARYGRRYLAVYGLGILFLLATNGLTVAIPRLIKEVFDQLATARDVASIDLLAALISMAAVTVIIVRTLSRILFFNPGRTIEFRVRNDMLERLLSMSANYFRQHAVGDLVSRAANDATHVRALVGFSVLMLLNLIMAAAFAFWQMFETHARLTLYCMIPMALSVVLMRYSVQSLYRIVRAAQDELGELSEHVLETLGGIATIQAGVAEEAFTRRFDRHNDHYTALHLRIAVVRSFLLPSATIVGHLCVFLLLLLGGRYAVDGEMTIGDIAAYASYIAMITGTLWAVGWLINSLQRGYVSLIRCWQVVDMPSDRALGETALATEGAGVDLCIDELRFHYPDEAGQKRAALDGVSLQLGSGRMLGIYGPVGSGKTTLVSLVSGLLRAPPGTITLDGVDVCEVRPDCLHKAVAVVPQEAFLFSRSLRENIGFVDPPGAIDEQRVVASVEKAMLQDEVERFVDGLETVVGERGLTLSGGQRQRAQLARALYRPCRLLVLDDVFSAVDHETEAKLMATIAGEVDGAAAAPTVLLVSSRISVLARCDEVIVLDDGQVVERGHHRELLQREGLYARAWQAQRVDA